MKSHSKIALSFVLLAIPCLLVGQGFLVRMGNHSDRVYWVSSLQSQSKPIDSIEVPAKDSRVLYNGGHKLFIVSRDEELHYHLDSLEFSAIEGMAAPNLGEKRFDGFLKFREESEHRGIGDMGDGRTELKCQGNECVFYDVGKGLQFYGLDENKAELLLARLPMIRGRWNFDFFQQSLLVVLAHYNAPNNDYGSRLFLFDLGNRNLLWNYNVKNDIVVLDIKVVENRIFIVFRGIKEKYVPAGPPSHCIMVSLEHSGGVLSYSTDLLPEFDPEIIEIL